MLNMISDLESYLLEYLFMSQTFNAWFRTFYSKLHPFTGWRETELVTKDCCHSVTWPQTLWKQLCKSHCLIHMWFSNILPQYPYFYAFCIPSSYRAIWNDLTDTDPYFFCPQESITVSFTEDGMWTAWGEWVYKRCEVSSNEKLLMVLRKVCNISVRCLEVQWAKTFYQQLSQLIRQRIECCTEDDMSRKLKKFEQMLNH